MPSNNLIDDWLSYRSKAAMSIVIEETNDASIAGGALFRNISEHANRILFHSVAIQDMPQTDVRINKHRQNLTKKRKKSKSPKTGFQPFNG